MGELCLGADTKLTMKSDLHRGATCIAFIRTVTVQKTTITMTIVASINIQKNNHNNDSTNNTIIQESNINNTYCYY